MKGFVALANFRTRLEAETVAGLLTGADVNYLIQSLEGAGFVPGPRGATIMVRPEDLQKSKHVIATGEEESDA